MVPGFGKQRIVIGSAPHCDIRLGGNGVQPEHAAIVHEGGGKLVFIDGGSVRPPLTAYRSRPAPRCRSTSARSSTSAKPRSNMHPALGLMLMQAGELALRQNELVFGRDPTRAHIVVQHPQVSGAHAVFTLNPLSVADQESTSGTWLNRDRLPPRTSVPLDPNAYLALGPVPLPVALALQLASMINARLPHEPPSGQENGGAAATPKKHKTVIGQIQRRRAGQKPFKTIGRTPENDIVTCRTRRSRAATRSCTSPAASSFARGSRAAPTARSCAASASLPASACRFRTAKRCSSARCRW